MSFEIFPWNDNLETGIEAIDEQHKKLVQLLNRLAAHLADCSHLVTLNAIFDELADYADYHFNAEEQLWKNYLGETNSCLIAHEQEHADFFREVQQLKNNQDENSDDTIRSVVSFLAKWLAYHILDSDKKMAAICLGLQSGMSAENAKLNAEQQMSGAAKVLVETVLHMYDSLFNRTLDMMRESALRRQAEEALKASEELYSGQSAFISNLLSNSNISERELADLVYHNSSQGMFVTDSDNQIISINPAFTQITGYAEADVIGKLPTVLLPDMHSHYSFLISLHDKLNSLGHWEGEYWNKRKNGEVYPEMMNLMLIKNDGNTEKYMVGMFSDVSKIKNTEKQLWINENYDSLTKLPNRHMFNRSLKREIEKATFSGVPLSLLLIDLDLFKHVNDSYGHAVGDSLLKMAAQRISNIVSNYGEVARIGGDEFTVILPAIGDGRWLDDIVELIITDLSRPFVLGEGRKTYISASVGITVYPKDATEADVLLKNADQAMYCAKRQGRNRYCYFTYSMQETAKMRQRLIVDLHQALKENQFVLYYQPIVDLGKNTISKAESLIRWHHPDHGMISPADFIPVAEETGLIVPLGDWVFNEAIGQGNRWNLLFGPDFQISINKSPAQFTQKSEHHDWLDDLDVNGSNFVIEITEGMLIENTSTVEKRIQKYKNKKIEVAIDDFGTGYSSLSYLNKFDIDYIRIDRSFINNLSQGKQYQTLCEAMILMAHKLNIKVIAEGVETEEQKNILIAMGCDYGQGYLFSPPVPADVFEQFMVQWQK